MLCLRCLYPGHPARVRGMQQWPSAFPSSCVSSNANKADRRQLNPTNFQPTLHVVLFSAPFCAGNAESPLQQQQHQHQVSSALQQEAHLPAADSEGTAADSRGGEDEHQHSTLKTSAAQGGGEPALTIHDRAPSGAALFMSCSLKLEVKHQRCPG
eukprot:597065-Pelagomonas_calceolata.AAC.2